MRRKSGGSEAAACDGPERVESSRSLSLASAETHRTDKSYSNKMANRVNELSGAGHAAGATIRSFPSWSSRMDVKAERKVSPNNPCPFLRALVAQGLLDNR